MTVGEFFVDLGRGLWQIVKDIHNAIYGKLKSKTWWLYIAIAFVAALVATGKFWDFIIYITSILLVCGLIWLCIKQALFGRGKGNKK